MSGEKRRRAAQHPLVVRRVSDKAQCSPRLVICVQKVRAVADATPPHSEIASAAAPGAPDVLHAPEIQQHSKD